MMKQYALYIGGILLVVGAILPLFLPNIAPYIFAIGALLFTPAQMLDRYEGHNLIIRRLRRQQVIGSLLFIVTAAMMIMEHLQLRPFRGGEWKIALLIAVFIEVYTLFRIDNELKREGKNYIHKQIYSLQALF